MEKRVSLLDCTLRDGCYIVNAEFGAPAIKGIIEKMQDAGAEIIECGWLRNSSYKEGTAFYHVPSDLEPYLTDRRSDVTYVVMIDWDRYDLNYLPPCDGKSIDAIRVVFPYGKQKEGMEIGKQIAEKGYKVFFQAANTLAYSNEDLIELAEQINNCGAVSLSVVDTFGAMYEEDLDRIADVLNRYLAPQIKLGFHSHNNQQLSFALTTHFIRITEKMGRSIVVDASLCGMGRGAGNATTELVVSYLNRMHNRSYDMDAVLDAIDIYMAYFQENFKWGYSTPYFIAGMYCCHVNNIAYLLNNHRTNARDIRNVIEALSPEQRKKYDYDLLEAKYVENQSRKVDDRATIDSLKEAMAGRKILLLAPGESIITQEKTVKDYIEKYDPVVIAVNAAAMNYRPDFLFLINTVRYEYAKKTYPEQFNSCKRILLSNIKTVGDENEYIVNFSRVNKMGWKYFDNAVVDCLRLLDYLHIKEVALAGFDGFKNHYNETYADKFLPTLNPDERWQELNEEITDMFSDFRRTAENIEQIDFLTESIFDI